jgi:uncharacterized coiled-coil DUF342 family protein
VKEKSELIQQCDEITQVKDELTAEISQLHVALEQERSKVKNLKAEILKYQKHTGAA